MSVEWLGGNPTFLSYSKSWMWTRSDPTKEKYIHSENSETTQCNSYNKQQMKMNKRPLINSFPLLKSFHAPYVSPRCSGYLHSLHSPWDFVVYQYAFSFHFHNILLLFFNDVISSLLKSTILLPVPLEQSQWQHSTILLSGKFAFGTY